MQNNVPRCQQDISTTHCVINQKSAVLVCFVAEAWNHAFKLCVPTSVHYLTMGGGKLLILQCSNKFCMIWYTKIITLDKHFISFHVFCYIFYWCVSMYRPGCAAWLMQPIMLKYVARPRLTFSIMELCLNVTVELGLACIVFEATARSRCTTTAPNTN
jgi:hypothetical protein